MNRKEAATRRLGGILLLMLLSWTSLGAAQAVCDYEPPESRITDLVVQGAFNWYDGPYADDRARAIAATLIADYAGLTSTAAFGQTIDARTEVRGTNEGWTADLTGSGSLLAFFRDDVFGVGAIGLDLSNASGIEFDLTAGVGAGRFRDVTPLALAVRVQNALLDLGELLAPVSNETLHELAQILGEIGPSDDEKIVRLAERWVETELVPGDELGIRGLLAMESILRENGETHLCGSDVQARVGASARMDADFTVSATGILLARYAAVPDPVSQLDSRAQARIRLGSPEEMRIDADVSYARRLPDGWTARAEYRLSIDRMWTEPTSSSVSHSVSGSLTTQIFGSVALSLVGDALYQTGDEELTLSLSVFLEADLF